MPPILIFFILTCLFVGIESLVLSNVLSIPVSHHVFNVIGILLFYGYLCILVSFHNLVRVVKEIQAIGIKDWIWFVVYLKRDEFSYKLSLTRYYPDRMIELVKDRQRAHIVDNKLEDLNQIKP